jgi:hypothetical protein
MISCSHLLLDLFSQTEENLELTDNEIGDKGAQQLADAIRKNTVSWTLFTYLRCIHTFLHRNSPNSTSQRTTLAIRELNIWLMLSCIARWISFYSHLSRLHLHFFTQTLTTFDLSCNKIGDDGVQSLADAIRNNEVKICSFISLILIWIFSCRHSPKSISRTMKSEIKGLIISPMLFNTTQYTSFFLYITS